MANYKNIRLEEHVYRMLEERMRPRESMSQVVERMLKLYDELARGVQHMEEIIKEDQ